MAKSDNQATDNKADSFYPEDARERNFEDARQTAIRNAERDKANAEVGSTEGDSVDVAPQPSVVVNPAVGPYGDLPKESTAPAPSNESDEVKQASAAANDKAAENDTDTTSKDK